MTLAEVIERAVDSKIAKALATKTQTVLAEYAGEDAQGKGWVVISGASMRTPLRRAVVEAEPGDIVSVTVGDGCAVMDANISNPSAGLKGVKRASAKADEARSAAAAADGKADAASDEAARAQQSADSAQQSADDAQSSADSAKSAADTAWQHADSAHEAAQTAWNHADEANDAAIAAQHSADDAADAAQTA